MGFSNFVKRFDEVVGWYPKEMPMEERNLVRKIDSLVLTYACLAFFTKYLDVSALTNAYVSGMDVDLNLGGNRLNYINAVYQVGYCAFQVPSNILITRIPSQYYLPTAEIVWGMFTLGTAFVQTYQQLLVMRFFVGFGATACYVGCLHIVNSWYKKAELGRRNAVYYSSMPLGTMIAGYLQSAAYTNLDGVKGMQGWRWLFIICTVITVPIAAFGYIFFPDTPERTKCRWMTPRQRELALTRLLDDGFGRSQGLNRGTLKRVLTSWQFYVFVTMNNLLWLSPYASGTPFTLWLQDSGKYSIPTINNLSTITSAVSIVSALVGAVYSDWRGNRFEMVFYSCLIILAGNIMLMVWDISDSAKFAAFILIGLANGPANLGIVWEAESLAHDPEVRAISLAFTNASNCALYLIIPLGAWQTIDAPRYYAGYVVSMVFSCLQLVMIPIALYMERRDRKFGRLNNVKGFAPEDIEVSPYTAAEFGEITEKGDLEKTGHVAVSSGSISSE
ncbi:major facilitator superfamily domain-containing protein [Dipodascopsis tothii]|uniref:major facilitator superfamily domain-containing protein n=1 Tax=Dipodascopsis tothii TaxID=44089 RepID=UPI0034CDC4C4